MASLQDIRRRIRSVKNTQQVTKAMKMISAVKLRKVQERLLALRPYASRLQEIVRQVVASNRDREVQSPLALAFLHPREEKRIRLMVMASDKGLCGGFNANVLKAAQGFLEESEAELAQLDVIGKRASEWARKAGRPTGRDHQGLNIAAFLETARSLAQDAVEQYRSGEIDALYVIFNHFNSPVSQVPTVARIFPMPLDLEGAPQAAPHLLEPDPETVLEALLPKAVETELLHCLLESSASEQGARMASMDKATSNAAEMIDKLTLHMNKVRQAAITNQIIEIVSGANA